MKPIHAAILGFALLTAGPATAFDLGEAARSAAGGVGQQQGGAAGLMSQLGDLNVSPQQALGGTGALMNVARNQLPGGDYAELAESVPGIERFTGGSAMDQLSRLGGGSADQAEEGGGARAAIEQATTMDGAGQAFSQLGMDSGMIGQFAPRLLDWFRGQGVGSSVLQSLGNVWGVGGS